MAIEIIKNKVNTIGNIKESDVSSTQFWENGYGTTLMTVPHMLGDRYLVMGVPSNGEIVHAMTLENNDLVDYLNRYLFEEVHAKIEINP